MSPALAKKRQIVTRECRPRLPRYIKLRHDEGRGRWLILAPERVFEPDETATSVLRLINGCRNVFEISVLLAQKYDAPLDLILADTVLLLQDLMDKGVVTARSENDNDRDDPRPIG